MNDFQACFVKVTSVAVGSVLWLAGMIGCGSRGPLDEPLRPGPSVGTPAFSQTLGTTLSGAVVPGNEVTTLENGREIFPAMLQAIRSARQTINFETFVYYGDETGRAFAEAIAERARAGVEVRVIIDAVGGLKSSDHRQVMESAGADVQVYHPLFWFDPFRTNHRTHRKLLIVDGQVGFIGGVGIGDEWQGNARSAKEWRDLHYRVTGPVVAQLQGAFIDNWLKVKRETLQGANHFPPLAATGRMPAAAFSSSPIRSRYSAELMYHLALAAARKTVRIINPYFLPDSNLTEALCGAARRGVKVQIIMPGKHMDAKSVHRASRKRWKRLIQAGVELYQYEPTMIHTKLVIVDDYFVSIGSINLDPRSLRINDEANLNVFHRGFALEQTKIFQKDLARSRQLTINEGGKITDLPIHLLEMPLESQL